VALIAYYALPKRLSDRLRMVASAQPKWHWPEHGNPRRQRLGPYDICESSPPRPVSDPPNHLPSCVCMHIASTYRKVHVRVRSVTRLVGLPYATTQRQGSNQRAKEGRILTRDKSEAHFKARFRVCLVVAFDLSNRSLDLSI
jgi:hypothetical protein